MKKIFAIALALVMVLSMASAFAANNCSTMDWTCTPSVGNCGKGKVEVVPYVMVNDACEAVAYEVSTCASAINTQKVYYAIKLTVEANPDLEWWKEAELKVYAKGMKKFTDYTFKGGFEALADHADWKKTVDQVWYLDNYTVDAKTGEVTADKWVNAADEDFDIADCIQNATVLTATKAKVCAKLTSDHDGVGTWKIGDYEVKVPAATATGTDAVITVTKTSGGCTSTLEMSFENGKINNVKGSKAFADEVAAALNLPACILGTCVDATVIERNFGWDDKVESCFSWSDKGASVVNPECVVTLPKTGDASLLWWLF